MEDFVKYTSKMCTVHGAETMLKITNTIVKILQEIITEPENQKFKSVRIAAQVRIVCVCLCLLVCLYVVCVCIRL